MTAGPGTAASSDHGEFSHHIYMANDRTTILRDGKKSRVVINGARKEVRIGCTTVSFDACQRIYALMRRHEDAVTYVAQRESDGLSTV